MFNLSQTLHLIINRYRHYFSFGAVNERRACQHLKNKHYEILAQNWRSKQLKGELDLVCIRGKTLILVEVKAKHVRGQSHLRAIDNFSATKAKRLQKMFNQFILEHRRMLWQRHINRTQIDLITIDSDLNDAPTLFHYENYIAAPTVPWIKETL